MNDDFVLGSYWIKRSAGTGNFRKVILARKALYKKYQQRMKQKYAAKNTSG